MRLLRLRHHDGFLQLAAGTARRGQYRDSHRRRSEGFPVRHQPDPGVRLPLPLRFAHAHRQGDPTSLAGDVIMTTTIRMNRRQFFESLGKSSLVVGFNLSPVAASLLASEAHAASADSSFTILSGISSGPLSENDAWITIDHQGKITLLSGKVELGTGTQTAFMQIVAEELDVDVSAITYVQGDTSQTPDQGTTAGSKSIQVQGPLVRAAAATAYQVLSGLEAAGGPGVNHPRKYAQLFNGQQILL